MPAPARSRPPRVRRGQGDGVHTAPARADTKRDLHGGSGDMAGKWWKLGRRHDDVIMDVATPSAADASAAPSFNWTPMFSRNWAFIAPQVQASLDRQVIFAAGVGLASVVATLACRTGFSRFILADGDVVDVSNLNRQAFGLADVG